MALKFNSVECPKCGANLPIEECRNMIFCSYCGTKVIMTNENEYIFRNIDEARLKEAEANENIQLKKLEIIDKRREAEEKIKKTKIIISIILSIVTLLFLGIGFTSAHLGLLISGMICLCILILMWTSDVRDRSSDPFSDKVTVPESINDFQNKSYQVIESIMVGAGFTNVKCVPLNDLRLGLLKKPGMVESITINGDLIECGGYRYSSTASVTITYHSF